MDNPIQKVNGHDNWLPFFCVSPLSPEQAKAAEQSDLARWRLDQRLADLHATPAPRGPQCGRGGTLHLRREREDRTVQDALMRLSCGRSDCPHCWRRRLSRTYRRAAAILLDEDRENRLPRVGKLHVAETDWRRWSALDRSIRRQHGSDVGRLRVRRTDGTLLVVCAEPFRGSRPLAPAEVRGPSVRRDRAATPRAARLSAAGHMV